MESFNSLSYLTSHQQASVSQGRICSDNCTCCHIQTKVADQIFHLTQSQHTDTGPTCPSTNPTPPGAWQGSHWNTSFEVTGMTRLEKKGFTAKEEMELGRAALEEDALRVDTVLKTKLAFKLIVTNGYCSSVHEKFLLVLDFLVTTTSTDTLASTGTLSL